MPITSKGHIEQLVSQFRQVPEPEMFAVRDRVYIDVDGLITLLDYRRRHAVTSSYAIALHALKEYLEQLRGEWE